MSSGLCERCQIVSRLCFCSETPSIPLETRVVVLMHRREEAYISNTARFATLSLPNSEIRVRGDRERPLSEEGLVVPERQSLFLFPSEDAAALTPEFAATLRRPVTLIVPDGTWRQAAKVSHRVKALQGVPRVKLAPGPLSEYRMRQAPRPECVCTFEAIARALGALEGAEVQERLERFFRTAIDRTLRAAGRR